MHNKLIGDCRFAAIDFESAGAERGETDQPVQIGVAVLDTWGDPPRLWSSYIAPGKSVLWSASRIHGITSDMLADAPTMMQLWPEIRQKLAGAVIIGHNPGTERRFLRCFPGHGFGPWIDTLALGRMCLEGLGNHTLQTVTESLGLDGELRALLPDRTWHDALFDALASWLVFRKIITELNLINQPLESLGASIRF